MLSNRIKVLAIGGPTCTGKSDLALIAGKKFDGEIVNGDSMQVYRYFDIGTAKPPADALEAHSPSSYRYRRPG